MAASTASPTTVIPKLAPEDELRASLYAFLAGFLTAPPSAERLAMGAGLAGDGSPLGRAASAFAAACRGAKAAREAEAFQELFIGLGRGELVPYGSYYLTGFLNEKPLAKLRNEMDRLGLARAADAREPEDHIAALLEIMAGLIDGRFGAPRPVCEQRAFFETHLDPWAPYFFRDLVGQAKSPLYAALGDLGGRFFEVEREAFGMVHEGRPDLDGNGKANGKTAVM